MTNLLFAQKSVIATPKSVVFNLSDQAVVNATEKSLPELNLNAIIAQDILDEQNGLPPRFGIPIDVNYDLRNAGVWTILPNNDRIWRLKITCPDAVSINLLYDQFWLPEGAKLHLYTQDKTQMLGAFTSENNRGTMNDPGKFTTGLLFDEDIILELYEPKNVDDLTVISVDKIVHGYKELTQLMASTGYGQSGSCQVNVNCPEGQNWQDEKKGVSMILVNGFRVCTGSLVNNTAMDLKPYFLTADHCIGSLDATGDTDASYYSFYWNYESNSCSNSSNYIPSSTSGATLKSNNSYSDFALFELTESPLNSNIDVYYNGWDRTSTPGQGGVGIHHPSGDFKKIATHNMIPIAGQVYNSNSHWRINWVQTQSGYSVTEGGSSGSPLFTNSKRLIGQLHGGSNNDCSNPANDPGEYGKFSVSWDASSPQRRLKDWLDPNNLNPQFIDGLDVIEITAQQNLVCANNGTVFTIQNASPPYSWTSSSNIIINSPTNGSSVTVQANNVNTRAPGFVQVTHGTGSETINVWVGKPKFSVLLTPDISLPEKFVYVDLINNNYSPNNQEIATANWQKTGGNGNLHAFSMFDGMGFGPTHTTWNVDVSVGLTNICGTTTTQFVITPPAPPLESVVPIPNATDEQFSLDFSTLPIDTYYIVVYDHYSNIHYSGESSNTEKTIETLNIPEGLYIVQIHDSQGNMSTKNLMVDH
ncbi:trypsin-like serine peptidase [Aequorivita marina]|uniref:trypsin-like serine peptidase n=1 Tax=Aequorivita marina TaxID=3073654 RepID=UPI002875379F|nr:trypsin-like serine protease [Aequorivita sp. S2608]MDS1299760.1 trypsin-like serine protease [Aequorivita sp. S2608]